MYTIYHIVGTGTYAVARENGERTIEQMLKEAVFVTKSYAWAKFVWWFLNVGRQK